MIRINKGDPPTSLVNAANLLNTQNETAFNADPDSYLNGTNKFKFTDAYRSDAVKRALTRDQHGKCCFSEAKFVKDEANVEHFRPKGRVDTWPYDGTASYPGYYWLAYEYSNLFYCKSMTNSSDKRNFFPLTGGTVRNRSHLDTNLERGLLINPAAENPRDHIRFENEEIKGISERGKKTIELLDLRHPQLDEARRTTFRYLKGHKESVDLLLSVGISINHPTVSELLTTLRDSVTERAEFSSMAVDLLTGWHHL